MTTIKRTRLSTVYEQYKDVLPMQLTQSQFRKLWRDYQMQRNANNATRYDRNGNQILFKLSFVEWLVIWNNSGQLWNRGRKWNQYVMSRYDDLGNYEIGNVHIQLQADNHKEYRDRYLGEISRHVSTPIGEFECMSHAAKALGISAPTIRRWLDNNKEGYSFC